MVLRRRRRSFRGRRRASSDISRYRRSAGRPASPPNVAGICQRLWKSPKSSSPVRDLEGGPFCRAGFGAKDLCRDVGSAVQCKQIADFRGFAVRESP